MRKLLLMLVLMLPLGACGTIDQVPLVYVSTVKVGVNAETGTTASPGGKVVIGVDATDAAYVPIAVARTCDKANISQCPKDSFPVELVNGDNSFSPAEFINSARAVTDQLRGIATSIGERQDALSGAIDRQTRAELTSAKLAADKAAKAARLEMLNARVASVDADNNPIPPPNPADDPTVQRLTSDIAANQTAEADLEQAKQQTTTARNNLDEKMAEFRDVQRSLSESLARSPDSIGRRKDALSVFGSFDANAKGGGSDAAGIVLGKSFSTGVAAQLLTEGLSRASSAAAVTKCLTAATLAGASASAAVKDVVLAEGIKACRTSRD